jgi:hypothetical protein
MRFIIMHKTNGHWEAGKIPGQPLIGRVGALIGELAMAQVFQGGEGLRATSQGVRLTFSEGKRSVIAGPFEGDNELAAGFSILRARSLDEAVEWASRQAQARGPLGDLQIDIRPVTEPWDIGLAPSPADVSTRRYMVLRKATAATEAGVPLPPAKRAELARLTEESTRAGVHIATETMRPSAKGRRYKNSRDGVTVTDGPFTESKELIAGYVIVSAASLDDASRWAVRYIAAVEADEVDLFELTGTSAGSP